MGLARARERWLTLAATATHLIAGAARYRGPVVAVWGDRDRLVPVSHHHGVRAAFPQARIEICQVWATTRWLSGSTS
jgi:pimeloyl-ACP methyl ester carboxylesterase